MAYTVKIQALDAICRSHGGGGGHVRAIRALNEWCVLLGGAGGHVRNVRALNEICALLGAEAGHFLEIRALNAIAAHLGGTGGHRRTLAALTEIAARTATGWAAGPVRLFGAGDSRFADGRQGTPPYDSGYVLHRYSALNLAVWGLRGKVVHDARTDLFATAGCTLEQWIDAHLAGLLAAMAEAGNPVVLIHLGTHSLPWVAAGRHAGPGQPDHRRPDRRRRAASSGSWRTRAPAAARSGRRTRRSASPTTPGCRRSTAPTAAGS